MNDSNYLRNKMHFTLGILGALFALHPFYGTFDKISFVYMGLTIPLSYALMTIGCFLAGATYFFAAGMASEHPSALGQRLGNYCYAMAMMTVPFYAGLYVTTFLEKYLVLESVVSDRQLHTPLITFSILAFWLMVWQVGGIFIRRYLTSQDWTNKIEGLIDREMDALKRAREMMETSHDDLAVIQMHKAVVTRLKMVCMKRGIYYNDPINSAQKAGFVSSRNKKNLDIIVQAYNVAKSTQPIAKQETIRVWNATKELISSTAV